MTPSGKRSADSHHILVVDDEEVMRRMLTRALGEASHWCASTGSGEEAVELLQIQRFDLAVVDKNLPDLNGIEVAREALSLRPPVPVIIVTGYPSDESKSEAESIGVSSYLTKPFGLYQLQREVDWVLESVEEPVAKPSSNEQPTIPPVPASETVGASAELPARPTRPDAGISANTNVAILIVEPDAGVRDALLTVVTDAGYRAVAFRSQHQAEIHVRHVGYDVLIARLKILRDNQQWAKLAPRGAPLGAIAILDSCAIDKRVEAIQLGAKGELAPPFEAATVVAEIRSAISRMREN